MGNQCCQEAGEPTFLEHPVVKTQNLAITPKQESKSEAGPAMMEINTERTHSNGDLIEKTIQLPDGSKYMGETKIGIPHGMGTELHENGDKFIGQFRNGIKTGTGRYEYANGVIYEGQFEDGNIEGCGRMKWPNGDWYEGTFKNNKMNGHGKYFSKQNQSYYDGTYFEGKRHGKGVIRSEKNELQGYWEMGVFKFKKVVPYDPL